MFGSAGRSPQVEVFRRQKGKGSQSIRYMTNG